jgi:hypothetical protein
LKSKTKPERIPTVEYSRHEKREMHEEHSPSDERRGGIIKTSDPKTDGCKRGIDDNSLMMSELDQGPIW